MRLPEMNEKIIRESKGIALSEVPALMGGDLAKMIVFGSCARGDYRSDSDIDIALLTYCSREGSKKYLRPLAVISTNIAMQNFSVVNFSCIPLEEFQRDAENNPFFINIREEGEAIYG